MPATIPTVTLSAVNENYCADVKDLPISDIAQHYILLPMPEPLLHPGDLHLGGAAGDQQGVAA